jgi:lantibiotic modifying enzyme
MVNYNIDVDVDLKENKVVATVTLTFKIFERGVSEEWTIVDEDFDENLNDVVTFIERREGKYFKNVKVFDQVKGEVRVVELKELSEDEVVKMIRNRLTNFLKHVLKLDERKSE